MWDLEISLPLLLEAQFSDVRFNRMHGLGGSSLARNPEKSLHFKTLQSTNRALSSKTLYNLIPKLYTLSPKPMNCGAVNRFQTYRVPFPRVETAYPDTPISHN